MLLATLLRHYKTYEGLHFVPISDDPSKTLSVYIGNNGVGKSSILEALDSFFNGRQWNLNTGSKWQEAFIAPVFLIPKDEFPRQKALDALSDFFWNVDETAHPQYTKSQAIRDFFRLRDHLKHKYSPADHLFLLIGSTYNKPQETYLSTFDSQAKSVLFEQGILEADLNKAKLKLLSQYNLIYIPIETSVKDVLAIEAHEMQAMMGREIIDEIDGILNKKLIEDNTGNRPRKMSIIELINMNLNEFMQGINDKIQHIDNLYSYKKEGRFKKNLTPTDVRDRIIDAYFKIRTLNKDNKEIHQLSSGQQRKALIDIAYAFLSSAENTSKKTILAIDEPEASMHTSMCFNQFRQLSKLANSHGKQVITTTHWYGLLPMCQQGSLHHISNDDSPDIASFDLSRIYEQRRSFPDDVELKSVFDLVSSILSMMKTGESNWLICEGSDDAIYLEHILNDAIPNLTILPVGGKGNVIKIYHYLFGPMSEKSEGKLLNGRVYCLIDTDREQINIDTPANTSNNSLCIRRFQIDDNEARLSKLGASGTYSETEFEDCLISDHYYEAVEQLIKEHGDKNIDRIFSMFSKNPEASYSKVNDNLHFLKPNTLEALDERDKLKLFLQSGHNKWKIAKLYSNSPPHSPLWIKSIIDHYR